MKKSTVDTLIIDSFAGGGGASVGIEMALGRSPDIAINHDETAIAMHQVNHPDTEHYCQNIWQADPKEVTKGRPVGLAWFSPDCKHFSKAKGSKPVSRNIRDLAWVVVMWAEQVKPSVIVVENVEEFLGWGPVNEDGMPCKKRKGETFDKWVRALRGAGYKVQWRELRASDYGAHTIRKRLFVVARCDGKPIAWPKTNHYNPKKKGAKRKGLKPWRPVHEVIDWSITCPSIFMTPEEAREWRLETGQSVKRPLADTTMRRIAQGIKRFVIDAEEPFIVTANHQSNYFRGQSLTEPMKTITAARDAHGLVTPFLTEHANASKQGKWSAQEPLRTQCAHVKGGHFALVEAFMVKHYGGVVGTSLNNPMPTNTTRGTQNQIVAATMERQFGNSAGNDINGPVGTTTTTNKTALVTSHMVKFRGTCKAGQPMDEPGPGLTAGGNHVGEVRALLMKYYGTGNNTCELASPIDTIVSKDRFGLVTVAGQDYRIADIGMRMLSPRELFLAQGFPPSYIIDRKPDGSPITKTAQVAACGNSVCPDVAEALVSALVPEMAVNKKAAE